MRFSKRQLLGLGLAFAAGPAFAFSGSTPSESPLPGIDIQLTRAPAGDAIAPIHIDSEHGKALVKMGAMQAATFIANILAPRLEKQSGISGKTWFWVLSNHLDAAMMETIFAGGGTELKGMQFAEDQGKTTWNLSIRASKP